MNTQPLNDHTTTDTQPQRITNGHPADDSLLNARLGGCHVRQRTILGFNPDA